MRKPNEETLCLLHNTTENYLHFNTINYYSLCFLISKRCCVTSSSLSFNLIFLVKNNNDDGNYIPPMTTRRYRALFIIINVQ